MAEKPIFTFQDDNEDQAEVHQTEAGVIVAQVAGTPKKRPARSNTGTDDEVQVIDTLSPTMKKIKLSEENLKDFIRQQRASSEAAIKEAIEAHKVETQVFIKDEISKHVIDLNQELERTKDVLEVNCDIATRQVATRTQHQMGKLRRFVKELKPLIVKALDEHRKDMAYFSDQEERINSIIEQVNFSQYATDVIVDNNNKGIVMKINEICLSLREGFRKIQESMEEHADRRDETIYTLETIIGSLDDLKINKMNTGDPIPVYDSSLKEHDVETDNFDNDGPSKVAEALNTDPSMTEEG